MNRKTNLTVAFALALGIGASAQADMFKPSKTDQVKLGKQAAAEVRQKEKVLPSSDIRVRVVRDIATRILSQMPQNKDPWEFSFDVIDNNQVNAFALPGGPMFFYSGLLDRFRTEDQLAGVIAHEMTHITREHWAYGYADQQKRALGLSVLLMVFRANRTAADIASISNDLLFNLPFSRRHETQADEVGLDLVTKAGYNPQGMVEAFQILQQSSKGGKPPEFLSTHPSDNNRIKNMENRSRNLRGNWSEQRRLPW
ncbi:MAG TPA: M48 family metallopeptidase [Fimbriimonadaceae bacterium]|nr:M48 family metallopeptidase [Fimbriimonadaceae bacterium]